LTDLNVLAHIVYFALVIYKHFNFGCFRVLAYTILHGLRAYFSA